MKLGPMAVAALGLVTAGSPAEKLLEEARLSLREAIEKAGPEFPGGSAVEARLRARKGRTVFQVTLAQGARRVTVTLDAKTSEVVGKDGGDPGPFQCARGAHRDTRVSH